MQKVLCQNRCAVVVTAFKPFGLRGGITGRNTSQVIVEQVLPPFAGRVRCVELPVNDGAIGQIDALLASDPDCILLTGEDASMVRSGVRIEPSAHSGEVSPWGVALFRGKGLNSSFASKTAAAMSGKGVVLREGIGTFWCNRVYHHALNWGEPRYRAVVFLHLGVFGWKSEKLLAVRRVIELMLNQAKFDRHAAALAAGKAALPQSNGQCAKYVRESIEAGGLQIQGVTSAKDMGASLQNAGFVAVETVDEFQVGDVMVIQPISSGPHGHAQIFDGNQWISDFKQKDPLWPNSDPNSLWKKEKPAHQLYRFSYVR